MTEPRGQVEWTTVAVPLMAEIQRNPDGTWTGLVRRLSRVVLTRETREALLQALADLHAQKAPK